MPNTSEPDLLIKRHIRDLGPFPQASLEHGVGWMNPINAESDLGGIGIEPGDRSDRLCVRFDHTAFQTCLWLPLLARLGPDFQ